MLFFLKHQIQEYTMPRKPRIELVGKYHIVKIEIKLGATSIVAPNVKLLR